MLYPVPLNLDLFETSDGDVIVSFTIKNQDFSLIFQWIDGLIGLGSQSELSCREDYFNLASALGISDDHLADCFDIAEEVLNKTDFIKIITNYLNECCGTIDLDSSYLTDLLSSYNESAELSKKIQNFDHDEQNIFLF